MVNIKENSAKSVNGNKDIFFESSCHPEQNNDQSEQLTPVKLILDEGLGTSTSSHQYTSTGTTASWDPSNAVDQHETLHKNITIRPKKRGELSTCRAWMHVIALLLSSTLIFGLICSFPLLLVVYLQKLGTTRAETAIVESLQFSLLYLFPALPSYLISKWGYRWVVVIGAVITSTGIVLSTLISNIIWLYATMGVIVSIGSCFVLTVKDLAPLTLFNERRPLVAMLVDLSSGLGMLVMPLLLQYLLERYSEDDAMVLIAGVVLQAAVMGMLLPSSIETSDEVRDSVDTTQTTESRPGTFKEESKKYLKLVQRKSFWLFVACTIASDWINGVRVFLVDYAILQGISAEKAMYAISLWGIMISIGKLISQFPYISKLANQRLVAMISSLFLSSIITLIFSLSSGYEMFMAYCILLPPFLGLFNLLWYLVLADGFSSVDLATAYSLVSVMSFPFMLVRTPLAGLFYDLTKNYTLTYLSFSGFGLAGVILGVFYLIHLRFVRNSYQIDNC